MDQVAALHWIQENIGELSGDSNNVTVIGHGYGASCVHLLMISPMARGMYIFHLFLLLFSMLTFNLIFYLIICINARV
jgi:carboxylesterase type B